MEELINEILNNTPIEIKHKKEIKVFSLGKAIDLPNQNDFLSVDRKVFKSHSSVFRSIKAKILADFFAYLESNKIPSVYIFWINNSDPNTLNSIYTNYSEFNKKNIGFKISLNALNEKTQILYVGKSEKGIDGRAICHLDYTGGKYKSLKIKDCCENTEIMVSVISFQIENNDDNYDFWKKILPYSVEYYLAKKLKPIIGKHK
jgi:hypothetical protein